LQLLVLSRDKQEKPEEGLRMLLTVTRDRKLTAAQTWILETAKRWCLLLFFFLFARAVVACYCSCGRFAAEAKPSHELVVDCVA